MLPLKFGYINFFFWKHSYDTVNPVIKNFNHRKNSHMSSSGFVYSFKWWTLTFQRFESIYSIFSCSTVIRCAKSLHKCDRFSNIQTELMELPNKNSSFACFKSSLHHLTRAIDGLFECIAAVMNTEWIVCPKRLNALHFL